MPTPFIDTKQLEQVKKYQEKGLNISEIARVMKKDYKQIYRYVSFLRGDTKYLKRLPKVMASLSTVVPEEVLT